MSKNCEIMSRMKSNYENRNKYFLTRRTPVIIRLDGKAFHTYTKGLDRPFDKGLIEDMQSTAIYLCQNIQGAKCAYTQSDEISILVTDFDDLQTQAWFDYNLQKMSSVSASLATGIFDHYRLKRLIRPLGDAEGIWSYDFAQQKLAFFDSRCFNIPKEEISNYFLARQKDCVKNSISMLAQSLYSHKELEGKNQSEQQELIFQKGLNWNDLHWSKKRGSFITKQTYVNNNLVQFPYELRENNHLVFHGEPEDATKDFGDLTNIVVRHKWEVTETPLTFNQQIFEQWL